MSRALQVAALGTALCLLAAGFGVRALYVPGIALVLLAGCAASTVRVAAWRAHVAREPASTEIEEGARLRLSVRVEGLWLPVGGGEVCGWAGAASLPLRRLRSASVSFTARAQRRGAHVIGPSVVRFRDPFGICTRVLLSPTSELLVLPRVDRVASGNLARVAGPARPVRRHTSDPAGADVDGLRPYRPGAPAARIHWPTVARTGALLERSVHDETQSVPLVVLDARRPESTQALDMAVRAAASLCVGLARMRGCSLLLPGTHRSARLRPDLAAWPQLHARLALVEPDGPLAWDIVERSAIVLWVMGRSAQTPIGPRGRAVDYTVSPIPLPGDAVLFAVAGCAVQRARAGAAARAA